MNYLKETDQDGVLLSLDFQKAFDMISTESILAALKHYSFSQYIMDWTNILYSNFKARIQNNGWFTEYFPCGKIGFIRGGPAHAIILLWLLKILAGCAKKKQKYQGDIDQESRVSTHPVC